MQTTTFTPPTVRIAQHLSGLPDDLAHLLPYHPDVVRWALNTVGAGVVVWPRTVPHRIDAAGAVRVDWKVLALALAEGHVGAYDVHEALRVDGGAPLVDKGSPLDYPLNPHVYADPHAGVHMWDNPRWLSREEWVREGGSEEAFEARLAWQREHRAMLEAGEGRAFARMEARPSVTA